MSIEATHTVLNVAVATKIATRAFGGAVVAILVRGS
jgi:hypothetical protein